MKKILSILIIACSISLQACVGAFIAGSVIGGVIVYEGRNATTKKADTRIAKEANKRLSEDPELNDSSRIVVSSYEGIILLAGQTPTQELKNQAQKIVAGVPGVRRVYNEITISGPISSIAQSNDAWLTTKVKSKLLATKGLDSAAIKVVTEDGKVYLMGRVSRKQGEIATEAARQTDGVQKVVTLFEYTRVE